MSNLPEVQKMELIREYLTDLMNCTFDLPHTQLSEGTICLRPQKINHQTVTNNDKRSSNRYKNKINQQRDIKTVFSKKR